MRKININNKKGARASSSINRKGFLGSKRSFEMPFSWIFAIIAGSFIILMAIYATTKFIQTSQYSQYSESAKSLGNLLNPVVNGVTSAYSTRIDFRKEIRMYINCSETSVNSPIFGRQTLAFSEESGFLSKWTTPGAEITRYNKYIFSNNIEQGKTLYLFSKPFYAGFRVDDLVYIVADNYCFVGAPEFVKDEINSINPGNMNLTANIKECKKNDVSVCFGFAASGCSINVMPDMESDYISGYVRKNNQTSTYYGDSLMYAAIFSSPTIYQCNVKRLGNKISALGQLYKEKIELVKLKECNSVIGPYIEDIQRLSMNMTQNNLKNIYQNAQEMDAQNCKSECKIYSPESC